jgi:hypothetical protein
VDRATPSFVSRAQAARTEGWLSQELLATPVVAGLDLSDKFGAIGATAMTKAAGLSHIPQDGTLNVFRICE